MRFAQSWFKGQNALRALSECWPDVLVLELEERVATVVKKLKERGLVSPYLRSFVVARINPLRWIKGDPPPLEDVLKTMRERVAKINVEKIKPQDLAGAAGPPDEEI
jgi:ParB family chromosome partitioning protein